MIATHTSPAARPAVELAQQLAAEGWHVFPLNPRDKRPLANCLDCRHNTACPRDDYQACPCLAAGQWCHGVRAATTNPDRIATWWRRQPTAIPAAAAGPSGLILIDLDNHTDRLPDDPAARLLPGIELAPDQIPGGPAAIRSGADVLRLLAHLRGGNHPWPAGPDHQPVSVTTPSGGRHLWYRAPHLPDGARLRQALGELGWQIDIKAAWSYGIAPGATTPAGTYTIRAGDPAHPGHLPTWLAREIARVLQPRNQPPTPRPADPTGAAVDSDRATAYLTAVIERGITELVPLTDGRKAALSALAYKTGGLLATTNLTPAAVHDRLTAAGQATGLDHHTAHRIVHRALTNGLNHPLPPPPDRTTNHH